MYSYLNLESTKTALSMLATETGLYSYLNLESTKTLEKAQESWVMLYSYLNLESTKTEHNINLFSFCCTVT